ncbi:MAG: hypothetical protein WC620_11075 [Methanoregula sp.]|jgi:hypothetical protein
MRISVWDEDETGNCNEMHNLIPFKRQNTITGDLMTQAGMVPLGDAAWNFSLKDQNDKTFDLYEHAQKRVLLSFHPLA